MPNPVTITCMRCDGKGWCVIKPHGNMFTKKKCPMCKGTGKTKP